MEPAVKDAAARVEPATKEATDGAIRPAGDYVSKNAVPVTKALGEIMLALWRTPHAGISFVCFSE